MSEFKGTPGPWDYNGYGRVTTADDEARFVADAYEEDDARIIAAAPDLLEALKPFAECCNSIDPEISDSKDISYWTFQAGDFRRARAAIAKALGEQK